jgi:cell division protein FtsI (penicillin-binding protein 3)
MTGRNGSRTSPSTANRSRRRTSTGSGGTTRTSTSSRARRGTGSGPSRSRGRGGPEARRGSRPARSRTGTARSARPATGRSRRRGRSGDPRRRTISLLVAVVALFTVAVIRLVYVQVLGSGDYVAYGEEQRIQPIALSGGRGSIFDRNGTDLAISIPQTTIAADPSVIADPADAARELAPALGRDEGELREALASDGRFVYLQRQVGDAMAARVRDLDIDGVLLYEEQTRFYPAGDLGRALLGQVDPDGSGVSGVEQAFDGDLSGEPGRLMVERDPSGRTIPAGRHQVDPAVPGDDLVLSLDGSLQYQVENILANQVHGTGAQAGVAIVSNPETGEILALANVALDPATGVVGVTGNDLAVTANYEPGSVNKLITLAAALDEGLVTPEDVITVPSSLRVADHTYYDSHPGDLTVTDVLAKSSNVGTIKLAQQLGKERLDEFLRRFGFGRSTGLGLPHEENGDLPDVDDWYGTSIGSIPIGHGISVTALQMLYAYNVIANDGVYLPPSLVEATVDEDGERHDTPPGDAQRVVSPITASQMRDMLTQVITDGTGRAAAIDGYAVAGKTGTARKPQPGGGYTDETGSYHYISTFAGFLPADDPKLSIIVVIDEPGTSPYAAEVAAPAFAEIGRHALRIMGVPPIAPQPRAPLAPEPDRVRATPAVAPTTLPPTTDTTAPAVPTDPAVAAAAEAAATASTAPPPDPVAGAPPLLLD